MSDQARQVAHTLATSAVRFLAGAFWAVIVARALGPEGRGGYAVLQTIAMVAVSLGHLSVDASHTALWPRAGERARAAIAANGLLLGAGVGAGAAICAAAVVVALGPGLLPVPGSGVTALALLAIPCGVTVLYLNNVLVLRRSIRAVNHGTLIAGCAPCVLLALNAVLGQVTLVSVTTLWLLSAALPLVVVVPTLRPRLRDRDHRLARRALGLGLRYHAGTAAVFLLMRVDVLVLNAFVVPAEVGRYAVAVTVMELTGVAAAAIAQVALAGQMSGDSAAAAGATARATRLSLLVTVVSVTAVCVLGPFVVPWIYGTRFGGAVAPLLGLAPGLVALSGSQIIGAFLLRLDRPVARSAAAGSALLADVALNLLLIPKYGITGCALASSAGYGVLAAVYVRWFHRATGMAPRRLLPGRSDVAAVLRISLGHVAR